MRPLLLFVVSGTAVLAVALLLPVPVPPSSVGLTPLSLVAPGELYSADSEDLTRFLESTRWGPLELEAPLEPPTPTVAPASPPPVVSVPHRLVGLISRGPDRRALVLAPEGALLKLPLGGSLPDGRVLVAVSGDRIVLRTPGTRTEDVLAVFPAVPRPR